MSIFVIKQTAIYEIEAETAEDALTAFLEIEGDSVLLPVDVTERTVTPAEDCQPN